MKPLDQFEEIQLDVLREIGNIGAGNAATSLSKLTQKNIDMKVPHVRILSFNGVIEHLGGSEQIVVAVFFKMEGDVPGNLFFFMQQETAKQLCHSILGSHSSETEGFEEMEVSALQEVGNILSGSYLSSLSDLTKLHIVPSVPSLAIDMAGAILSFGLMEIGQVGDYALIIDTKFQHMKEQNEGRQTEDLVSGQFVMIPEPTALATLFKSLGVPYHE